MLTELLLMSMPMTVGTCPSGWAFLARFLMDGDAAASTWPAQVGHQALRSTIPVLCGMAQM